MILYETKWQVEHGPYNRISQTTYFSGPDLENNGRLVHEFFIIESGFVGPDDSRANPRGYQGHEVLPFRH